MGKLKKKEKRVVSDKKTEKKNFFLAVVNTKKPKIFVFLFEKIDFKYIIDLII